MTTLKRIQIIFRGIITILVAVFLSLIPDAGAPLITLALSISMIVSGIYSIGYYITMARYMVDGQFILYKGILLLNTGIFVMELTDVPLHYIMIYLLIGHGFTGLAGLLKSLEARRMEAPAWRMGALVGIGNILISILCLIFINSPDSMVYIYSLSLIGSSIADMSRATKRTAMVYIQ